MNRLDEILGSPDPEYLRVAAVNKCREVLTLRGWQVGESDAKCRYDIFGVKENTTIKVQVRSSTIFSRRGYPKFKTARQSFNTKRICRHQFAPGDFDFWFSIRLMAGFG